MCLTINFIAAQSNPGITIFYGAKSYGYKVSSGLTTPRGPLLSTWV